MPTYEELTRKFTYSLETKPDNDDLQLSALLRIAEASEKMAESYSQIIKAKEEAERLRDRNWKWFKEMSEKVEKLERSNRALRGVITRMKNERENG